MTDVSFELSLVEAGQNWVLTASCRDGEANATIAAPFTADELSHRLAEVEKSIIRSTSPVVTRRAVAPDRVTREFGRELSAAVLDGNVRLLFDRARVAAKQQNGEVRVLLKPVGRSVCRIPWEFVTDPDAPEDYLALRASLVRSAHLMAPVPPLQVEPPLRVLGLISRPSDLPQLEADQERAQITETLETVSSDRIQIDWLESNRWRDLQSKLRSGTYHVFHFIGHGGFDEESGGGYVELTNDQGRAHKVQATDLGRLAHNNPMLRLVMLNACESASSGDAGVFSSTAATLLQQGVPAVVAMQYEVTDPAALAFAGCFYEGVARGKPVDQAVTFAREEVKVTFGSLEWATPVLFLASNESEIFRMPPQLGSASAGAVEDRSSTLAPPSAERGTSNQSPSPGGAGVPRSGIAAGGPPARSATTGSGSDWVTQLRRRVADAVGGDGQRRESRTVSATGSGGTGSSGRSVDPNAPPRSDVTPASFPTTARARTGAIPKSTLSTPAVLRVDGPVERIAFGPVAHVAAACGDGAVRVLSRQTGRTISTCLLPQGSRPRRLVWSPWPRHLASLHDGGLAVVWDLETEVPVRVISTPAERSGDIAMSASGRWLAVAADDLSIRVFDADGAQVKNFSARSEENQDQGWRPALGSIISLAFAPGDRHVVLAGDDGLLRKFDVHGRLVTTWAHPRPIAGTDLCPSGLTTGSADGRLRSWGWDGRLLRRMDVGAPILFVATSRDGRMLATATEDSVCQIWDNDGTVIGCDSVLGRPTGLGFSLDADTLACGTDAGEIRTWSLGRPDPGIAR